MLRWRKHTTLDMILSFLQTEKIRRNAALLVGIFFLK